MAKAEIAHAYGVSETLVRYRLQVTGVDSDEAGQDGDLSARGETPRRTETGGAPG